MSTRNLDYIINLRDGKFSSGMNKAINKSQRLDNTFRRLGGTIAAALSINVIGQFIASTSKISMRMEALDTQLNSFSGDEYVRNMGLINEITTKFNSPIKQATEGWTKFSTAATLAGLGPEATRTAFKGLSMANRVFQLDAMRSGLVQNALTQMLSKGKVSAEELRQQLGEHLPGAFALAAKAMNMTLPQLNKALEDGALNSVEFVTRFGQLMVDEYGAKIPDAMTTTQAKIDGLNNKIFEHQMGIGDNVIPLYVKWMEIKVKFYGVLQKVSQAYDRHKETIDRVVPIVLKFIGVIALAKTALWLGAAASAAYSAAQLVIGIVSGTASIGVWGMVAAMSGLQLVMDLLGIGLIIAGIVLLTKAIIKAYKTSEKFRAVLAGIGNAFKTVHNTIMGVLSPIRAFWMLLRGDKDGAIDVLSKGVGNMIAGVRGLSSAFQDGYDNSIKISKEADKWKTLGSHLTGPGRMPGLSKTKSKTVKPEDLQINNLTTKVSSGRSVRNISVTIEKGIESINIHTNNLKENACP